MNIALLGYSARSSGGGTDLPCKLRFSGVESAISGRTQVSVHAVSLEDEIRAQRFRFKEKSPAGTAQVNLSPGTIVAQNSVLSQPSVSAITD